MRARPGEGCGGLDLQLCGHDLPKSSESILADDSIYLTALLAHLHLACGIALEPRSILRPKEFTHRWRGARGG